MKIKLPGFLTEPTDDDDALADQGYGESLKRDWFVNIHNCDIDILCMY